MVSCHAVVLVVAVVIAVVFVSPVLLTPSLHQPLLVFSGQCWKNKNSFEIHSGLLCFLSSSFDTICVFGYRRTTRTCITGNPE